MNLVEKQTKHSNPWIHSHMLLLKYWFRQFLFLFFFVSFHFILLLLKFKIIKYRNMYIYAYLKSQNISNAFLFARVLYSKRTALPVVTIKNYPSFFCFCCNINISIYDAMHEIKSMNLIWCSQLRVRIILELSVGVCSFVFFFLAASENQIQSTIINIFFY